MSMQYGAPPPQPTLFSNINWRSPLPYLIIVGGGIALFLVYKKFAGSIGSGSTSSSTAGSGGTVPYVDETVYNQTLQGPQLPSGTHTASPPIVKAKPPTTGGTAQPPIVRNRGGARTATPPIIRNPGVRPGGPGTVGGTKPPVAAGRESPAPTVPTLPPNTQSIRRTNTQEEEVRTVPEIDEESAGTRLERVAPVGVANYERELQAHGEGPGNAGYLHVPTWPYGGQRVRPRLG